MSNLLLGWLSKVNPTSVLLVLAAILMVAIALAAVLAFMVVLGPSDDPTNRVVLILDAVGDVVANARR